MRSTRKSAVLALSSVVALVTAAGCGTSATPTNSSAPADGKSGSAAPGDTSGQKVTLPVVSLLPGSEKAAFKAFDDQVAIFEKANPNIDVQPKEYEWKATTFAAQLAGGTLPTVFEVPFTDTRSLIANKQIADISTQVKALPYASTFNPNVLAAGSDANGAIYALPKGAYGNGLQYNRDLFTKAGLDPNKPPTTWEEVRADAKAISEKTGKAGFAIMGKSNTGGWNLTTLTYALGGRVESVQGDKATATVDNPATKQVLDMLKAMRWDDKSMGSNFLLDWGSMNQEFAAGKVGMYISGSDVYTALKQTNKIKPELYGLTAIPTTNAPDAGVLSGGTEVVVKANATEAEKAAAVKWIDFYYVSKLTTEEAATRDAKTQAASGQPVGTPQLPLFDQASLDKYNGWIKPYIDVPLPQMTGFTSALFNQKPAAEPPVKTQEIYGLLDSVVQKVMTDKNADTAAVLSKANADAQKILDKS